MADSRLFLYGALLVLLFLVWQTWEQERAPAPAAAPAGEAAAPPPQPPAEPERDVPEARAADVPAPVARAAGGERIRVRTDVLELLLDPRGGSVVQVDLPRFPVSLERPDAPVRLLYADEETYTAQSGLTHDAAAGLDHRARAPTHKDLYRAERLDYDFRGADAPRAVALHWRGPDGLEARKTYRFAPGRYLIEVEHELRNGSGEEWVGRQYRQLRRSAGRAPDRASALFGNTQALSFIGPAYHDAETYHKLSFEDLEEREFAETYTDGWIALLQHYFVSAWIPERGAAEHYYTRVIRGGRYPEYIIGMHSPATRVAPGGRATFATQLYVGPKEQNRLAEIADGLDLTVDYGVLTVLSKPLFWVLDWIYALVGNWGWAIVLLTVLIKLAFYKLSEASYRSMAKMRKFAPRFQQLRERHADDRAKLNEAMMKMYREEKVNPLGGCWPILVQIPVFIALYWVLLESVELRQAPFVGWVQDLSVRDPYYVLPVLMGASMIVQTKLNPTPPDPFQAKLMMALPVVFTVFFLFFPAGLVLYWLVNNLLSIAQQWYIIRRMDA